MYNVKKIKEDIFWVGVNDRRINLFENVYPVPRGVSYNAYLITDEKTALLDTVDYAYSDRFMENLEYALGDKALDYLIVNHMEPDHCAGIRMVISRYPGVKLIGNAKTLSMLKQFFNSEFPDFVAVKEGDRLSLGQHELTFVMAPMVHWPEVMVTFDLSTGTLFSADAFGSFGTIDGSIWADEADIKNTCLDEVRRYYTNIVGKYGTQVNSLLSKAASLEINTICPLHGCVWREDIDWLLGKYQKWADYEPEKKGVVIAYASVYSNTQNAAEILSNELTKNGVTDIKMYDVSVAHPSYVLSDCFKYSHLVFASTTYNAGIFCNMETLLNDIKHHNLQNRTVALVENGTWAPMSGKLMRQVFEDMKDIKLLPGTVTVRSAVKEEQRDELEVLAKAIAEDMNSEPQAAETGTSVKYGWRCKICGYTFEGDTLPEGFTCPLCGRGPEFFEKVEL